MTPPPQSIWQRFDEKFKKNLTRHVNGADFAEELYVGYTHDLKAFIKEHFIPKEELREKARQIQYQWRYTTDGKSTDAALDAVLALIDKV